MNSLCACFSHNTKLLDSKGFRSRMKEIHKHLHIKQTEISQKQSKKAKIFQRSYFIILKVLPNKTIKNFEVRGTLSDLFALY